MKAREGELVKTKRGIIFDVKGLVHPPNRIIAFPRYIPSPEGAREYAGELYGKVYSFADRFKFLEEKTPELIVYDPVFDAILCEVPINTVTKHYKPVEKFRKLRSAKKLTNLERKAVQLAEDLIEADDIPWNCIGISGSILVGVYTLQSDIDPVVYGIENCRKAYGALKNLLEDSDSRFKRYNRRGLHTLFDFRSKDTIMSFEDFVLAESRKAFQGLFNKTDYFIRFVKDWNQTSEQYGEVCYKDYGYARIAATVADSEESLFTPCTYKLENVKLVRGTIVQPITEIASFRGRFCEQLPTNLREPPTVEAQGKVEQVTNTKTGETHYRLLLGNKPSDYMVIRLPKDN